MKVKTLKRTAGERECRNDVRIQSRNLNPQYHPMQRAREYTRAVNSAKLDRLHAKPLVGNLGNGHRDAVYCTATSRRSLVPLVSGAADGTVHLWDLPSRKSVAEIAAHNKAVTGVCFSETGQHFYSCSKDGQVNRWSIHAIPQQQKEASLSPPEPCHGPLETWKCNGSFQSMDHSWNSDQFVTASDSAVQVWSPARTTAIQTHGELWGSSDSVTCVRCHPVETTLVAHATADRGIGLHDTRAATALKKTTLQMRTNDIQWNPMEPMNFAVANEDYQAYLFDMRKLREPFKILKGHVNAIMSVSWSPTGRELATASYDRTLRIFPTHGSQANGSAREIYHTKRMQRIFTINFTQDAKFIVSGSDDTNLRLWKASASEQLGQLTLRQEAARDYRQALVKKYKHLDGVKKISRSRKVPKAIKNQTKQAQIVKASKERKLGNRVKYQKDSEFVAERKKTVVKETE